MHALSSRIAVVLLLLAPPVLAQTSPADTTPNAAPPERVDLPGAVEVPIALVNNLPIVEARVNGQGPFRFGIETGADFVIVSPELVSKLGLKRTGGPEDTPEYHVDRIDIGEAAFHSLPVAALRVAQGGIDGVLGLPFYRILLLTIDYPHARARFERGALPEADGRTVLALTHIGPFWGLPLTIGDASQHAVLDTRSTGAFGFTPESAAALKFDGEPRVVGRARGAAIPEAEVKGGRLAGDVTIGRYTFPKPMVTIRPLPPGFPSEAIVGTKVLSRFTMTLDQRNARLRLLRDGPDVLDIDALPTAPAVATADYAGRYGVRAITVDADGRLFIQREGGPPLEMVSTGHDTFTLKDVPQAKLEFMRDASGKISGVRILNREGQWETVPRDR